MCSIPDEVVREAYWIFIRSRFNRNSSTNSKGFGILIGERVPIATRLSICTPTIQFKMALYIDEAVSPAVVKTF